jgi:hypothetical protein
MQFNKKIEKVGAIMADAPADFRDMVMRLYMGRPAPGVFDVSGTINMTAAEFTELAGDFQRPHEDMRDAGFVKIMPGNLPVAVVAEFDAAGRARQIGFEITEG